MDKTLFITGASSGIGAATARAAVQAGWRVGLFARSKDKLEALAESLGDKAMALPGDATDLDSQRSAMETFANKTGGIDAAFANAGTIQGAVAGVTLPDIWPDQRQTLRETLKSYTQDYAWVEFNENRKGQLAVGMMADIVVMDADIEATDPTELGRTRAAVTICAGHITYQA